MKYELYREVPLQADVSGTAVMVRVAPEHGLKKLVQHLHRAAHFLATSQNQFLGHLFPSFLDVEAEIPL